MRAQHDLLYVVALLPQQVRESAHPQRQQRLHARRPNGQQAKQYLEHPDHPLALCLHLIASQCAALCLSLPLDPRIDAVGRADDMLDAGEDAEEQDARDGADDDVDEEIVCEDGDQIRVGLYSGVSHPPNPAEQVVSPIALP